MKPRLTTGSGSKGWRWKPAWKVCNHSLEKYATTHLNSMQPLTWKVCNHSLEKYATTHLKSMQPLTWQNHATTEQHHTTSYSAQHHQVTTALLSKSYNQALTEPLHATTYSATNSRGVQVEKSPWAIHFLFMGVSSVTLSATSSLSINTIIVTHQHHHGYSLSSITGVASVTLSATSSSSWQ